MLSRLRNSSECYIGQFEKSGRLSFAGYDNNTCGVIYLNSPETFGTISTIIFFYFRFLVNVKMFEGQPSQNNCLS